MWGNHLRFHSGYLTIAGLCHDTFDKISTTASRLRKGGMVPQGHRQSESRRNLK